MEQLNSAMVKTQSLEELCTLFSELKVKELFDFTKDYEFNNAFGWFVEDFQNGLLKFGEKLQIQAEEERYEVENQTKPFKQSPEDLVFSQRYPMRYTAKKARLSETILENVVQEFSEKQSGN